MLSSVAEELPNAARLSPVAVGCCWVLGNSLSVSHRDVMTQLANEEAAAECCRVVRFFEELWVAEGDGWHW